MARPAAIPSSRPLGRKFRTIASPKDGPGPNDRTLFNHEAPWARAGWRTARTPETIPRITRAVPMMISATPNAVCCVRTEATGSAWAPRAATDTTRVSPATQPIRNAAPEMFRFGESRIKIVAVIGTELNATATAIGSSCPSADSTDQLLVRVSRHDGVIVAAARRSPRPVSAGVNRPDEQHDVLAVDEPPARGSCARGPAPLGSGRRRIVGSGRWRTKKSDAVE